MPASQREYWLILVIALVAIVCGAIFVGRHMALPSDGARLEPGSNALTPRGAILTPLGNQGDGLQAGDLVVAIQGRSLESWAQNLFPGGPLAPGWERGDTLQYTLIRDGQQVDVPVTLGDYPIGAVIRRNWGTIAYAIVYLVVAAFVFVRRPQHPAGRILFLSAAFLTSSTAWSFGLGISDFVDGIGFWLFKVCTLFFYNLYWTANFHFTMIFPQPLPIFKDRRWLLPAVYLLPMAGLVLYLAFTGWRSTSTLGWFDRWTAAEGVHAAVFLSLALAALIWQYRRNMTGATRRQIRWVVLAGLLSGGAGLLFYILPGVLGLGAVGPNVVGLIVIPYPVAIAIAILRHNLFDIDTLINRTLVYGTLTAGTMAIYIFIVGYIGDLVQARDRTLIAFLAAGLVAVLFQPLRERLQRAINRLMYGERDEPYTVLSRLDRRLEASVSPEATLPIVVESIAQALKLPYVGIELLEGQAFVPAASYGLAPVDEGGNKILPLAYQKQPMGRLILSPRGTGETFTPAEERLLEDIARHVGVAAHAAQLTAHLQRSRQRIVATREEERRRLRRDLHDGLGPQLASLTLMIDAARNSLNQDPRAADEMLRKLKAQTKSALSDIRRIAYDLRPPALDQLGLIPAIKEHMAAISKENGVEFHLEHPSDMPMLPAAVEVAAYRIVLEALTNVLRHAQASRCSVALKVDRHLEVHIRDDGRGLPDQVKSGIGLHSMAERAAELGGTLRVERGPAGGTRVLVRLPLEIPSHDS